MDVESRVKWLVVLLFPLLGACAREATPDPATLAERYVEANFDVEGNPTPGFPILASLDLDPEGRYEVLVLNGITADGCGTFEGAGSSHGTWAWSDGRIVFDPDVEPSDLALSMSEASARLTDDGLLVTIDERERRLVTPDVQKREWAAWEGR